MMSGEVAGKNSAGKNSDGMSSRLTRNLTFPPMTWMSPSPVSPPPEDGGKSTVPLQEASQHMAIAIKTS